MTFFLGLLSIASFSQENKPNVLIFLVDDLRADLYDYFGNEIIAPNMQQLSSESVAFDNAFVNVPVCGASRASFLTGIRPNKDRFLGYTSRMDKDTPDAITFAEHFKQNGYITISNGKVAHNPRDMAHSWTQLWTPEKKISDSIQWDLRVGWRDYQDPQTFIDKKNGLDYPAFEQLDVSDESYFDGKLAQKVVDNLDKLKTSKNPFLLVCGFVKPHLPFTAPSKYWDQYNYNEIDLPKNNFTPKNAPKAAQIWYELPYYRDIEKDKKVKDSMAKKLIHGYLACVSYIDHQIGKVLKSLEDNGLSDNTIVILTSDNGFSLSEHNRWSKHNLFMPEVKVPLVIKIPGVTPAESTTSYAELIDIYPTLCEITGLTPPQPLDGESLIPVLISPDKEIKKYALSRFAKGDLFISDKFNYAEWKNKKGQIQDRMLYNNVKDPLQTVNVVNEIEYKEIADSLSFLLNQKIKI